MDISEDFAPLECANSVLVSAGCSSDKMKKWENIKI